jgi:hypothetical protein
VFCGGKRLLEEKSTINKKKKKQTNKLARNGLRWKTWTRAFDCCSFFKDTRLEFVQNNLKKRKTANITIFILRACWPFPDRRFLWNSRQNRLCVLGLPSLRGIAQQLSKPALNKKTTTLFRVTTTTTSSNHSAIF